MRAWVISLTSLVCMAGCTTPQAVLHSMAVPGPVASAPIEAPPPPSAVTHLSRLTASEPTLAAPGPKESAAAVAWAYHKFLVNPAREYFRNGILVYPWADGRIYKLRLKSQEPTDIFFPSGERLIPGGSGADDWWHKDEVSGAEPGTTARVILTPKTAGLKKRITLVTTGGAYYLDVESVEGPGLVAVTWHKPPPVEVVDMPRPIVRSDSYVVDAPSPPPSWVPVRVWNDGAQTYIECHPEMLVTEAPVVFLLDREGKRQMVHQYQDGATLVIPRLGQVFELQGTGGPTDLVRVRRVAQVAGGQP